MIAHPHYASAEDLERAADTFVAAIGQGNQAWLMANLNNVALKSDALRALVEALHRSHIRATRSQPKETA